MGRSAIPGTVKLRKKRRAANWRLERRSCAVLTGKQATRAACACSKMGRAETLADHSRISRPSSAARAVRMARVPQRA